MAADQAINLALRRSAAKRPQLSLFGLVELRAADNSEIPIANRRARALLALLALEPDLPITRDQVSKLLWPGRFEAQARASLRQCLLELGKSLEVCGPSALVVTRDRVGLATAILPTDLTDLERALANGDFATAVSALRVIGAKPLLDQFSFGEGFGAWIDVRRSAIEQRLHAWVRQGLLELAARGDLAMHAALLEAWAVRDPSAWRLSAVDGQAEKTRIAVLPFAAIGLQDSQDYFADGMADELITTLGQVPQLLVAGRTSSFHFRNSDLTLAEIASALRVSHIIEGSVQRQEDQVRISVRLLNGETGFETWAHRYEGSLNDIFDLQENVAQAVTAALGVALGIAMQPPLLRGETQSKAAYDLYLQGRALCARLFGDGVLAKAVALLEQCVALDPKFAQGWEALGEAHQLVAIYTPCLDRPAASARMAECAGRAIALNPKLGYPHALLGVHAWTQNDIVGALDLALKAYGLEPENPAVAMRLGSFLLYCGRTTQAMKYIEAAIDQDPVDGRKFTLRAVGKFNLGDMEGALEAGRRMVDLGFPSMWLAVITAATGQHDLAIAQYQQTRKLMGGIMTLPAGAQPQSPEFMDAYWAMAANGACSGQEADRVTYCQMLDMMHATLHDPADPAIVLPAIFMGYADMVMKALSLQISPANTLCFQSLWADVEPISQIWQHPEFIPFAQKIGLAAAWDKYGWPDLLPPPSNLAAAPTN